MQWYLAVLKNYVTFSGRARRKEYWMFTLINLLIAVVLLGIGMAIDPNIGLIIYMVYLAATLLPTLAVLVRRLHDTGRSGWWYFISFIPLVGPILLLVYTCSDSNPEPNQYGPNPKMVPAA